MNVSTGARPTLLALLALGSLSCGPFDFYELATSLDSAGAIETDVCPREATTGRDFFCAVEYAAGSPHTILLGLRYCGPFAEKTNKACLRTESTAATFLGTVTPAAKTDAKSRARLLLTLPENQTLASGLWQCFAVTENPDHKPGEGAAEMAKNPANYMADAPQAPGETFDGDYGISRTVLVR